jgi:hypothetical protein
MYIENLVIFFRVSAPKALGHPITQKPPKKFLVQLEVFLLRKKILYVIGGTPYKA